MSDNLTSQPKVFVIDTNVFVHRPEAMLSFKDNEIVIPLWVLEELDKLKTFSDEKGRNARKAIRMMDEAARGGNLAEGVKLENGSILRVVMNFGEHSVRDLAIDKNDNKIILTALQLQSQGRRVFFVSKDINARVKAQALGIKAVDYEKQKVNADKLYPGYTISETTGETIDKLRTEGTVPWTDAVPPNHFILFNLRQKESNARGAADSAIARWHSESQSLQWVYELQNPVAGINPLNPQQQMAFDLLLDPAVSLVTLVGKAGTGKTLLAIAAGLKLTLEDKAYTRVLVSRPVIPMGKDIGYLPGAKNDKLSAWMQPLFDNLEFIMTNYHKPGGAKTVEQMISTRVIELEALTYIRGRSLPKQYIIIDEAQNLTPHEVKTIVSRAGEGSKVVLTGDPYQIDSPYLDASSNGLSYLVEAFRGQDLAGHVTMGKSERSRLAELAAELL